MQKNLYIILTLLFLSSGLLSQNYNEWAERLNGLETTLDPNNKRHELQSLSKQLSDLWKSENDLNELLRCTSKLYANKSEDGFITMAAFGSDTYDEVYQLEWLINFKGKTWSFSEELSLPDAKEKNNLRAEISSKSDDVYGVRIFNGKRLIVDASDLITKCLFEDLQLQQSDAHKDSVNAIIQARLMRLWSDKDFFQNDFSQLKRMKTLHSKDGLLKICTYNIQKDAFKQAFYGSIIINDGNLLVKPLTDASEDIKSPERSTFSDKKWYGAIYLDLIETSAGNKTYYTLVGYRGHDEFLKTRVLDVLTVQNGRIRFGAPIFKTDRITRNRIVFEYSAKTTMMLRYDVKEKLIVFDNLAPADPMFRGVYQYYGPDFSYNAFKFTNGIWELKKDIDLRNPKR
jgi:hypothetical protein